MNIVYISPSGSDTAGDGSVDLPYKTITHAYNNTAGTDIEIVCLDGSYALADETGQYALLNNSTKNAIIRSFSGDKASVVFTSASGQSYGIRLRDCGFVRLKDLTVTGPANATIYFDGIFPGNAAIENCDITNTSSTAFSAFSVYGIGGPATKTVTISNTNSLGNSSTHGIYAEIAGTVIIADSHISLSGSVSGSSTAVRRIRGHTTIINSSIATNRGQALRCDTANETVKVSRCTISSDDGIPLHLGIDGAYNASPLGDCSVDNCKIISTKPSGQHALLVGAGCDYASIVSCQIISKMTGGGTDIGIVIKSDFVKLLHNKVASTRCVYFKGGSFCYAAHNYLYSASSVLSYAVQFSNVDDVGGDRDSVANYLGFNILSASDICLYSTDFLTPALSSSIANQIIDFNVFHTGGNLAYDSASDTTITDLTQLLAFADNTDNIANHRGSIIANPGFGNNSDVSAPNFLEPTNPAVLEFLGISTGTVSRLSRLRRF